jgi:hypothetical protein
VALAAATGREKNSQLPPHGSQHVPPGSMGAATAAARASMRTSCVRATAATASALHRCMLLNCRKQWLLIERGSTAVLVSHDVALGT